MAGVSPIRISVSHTSTEHELVESWRTELETGDEPVLLDAYVWGDSDQKECDLRPGDSIFELAERIAHAPARIVVLSECYVEQDWCLIELYLILASNLDAAIAAHIVASTDNPHWSEGFRDNLPALVDKLMAVANKMREKLKSNEFDRSLVALGHDSNMPIDKRLLRERIEKLASINMCISDTASIRSFVLSKGFHDAQASQEKWIRDLLIDWVDSQTGKALLGVVKGKDSKEIDPKVDGVDFIDNILPKNLRDCLRQIREWLDRNKSALLAEPENKHEFGELINICVLRWACPRWSALQRRVFASGVPFVFSLDPEHKDSISLLQLQAIVSSAAMSQTVPKLMFINQDSAGTGDPSDLKSSGQISMPSEMNPGPGNDGFWNALIDILELLWNLLWKKGHIFDRSPSTNPGSIINRGWGDLDSDSNPHLSKLRSGLLENRESPRPRQIVFELQDLTGELDSHWRKIADRLSKLFAVNAIPLSVVRIRYASSSGRSTLHMIPYLGSAGKQQEMDEHRAIEQLLKRLVDILGT